MSDDPGGPLRWERDSDAEDFEAHRAGELDALARWAAERRYERLTRALEEHGITRRPSEVVRGGYVVPDGWAEVVPPEPRCPWCETPGGDGAICGECADVHAASPDLPSMVAHWEALDPLARRLHLSARHGIDPWTGERVRIEHETARVDDDGLAVERAPLFGAAPATSWDRRRGR
jgi:hypothetical protein